MPPTRLRQSHILKALKELHGGCLADESNAAAKLLGSMGFTSNKQARLVEQLQKMHECGSLVVLWTDEVATSISLPELAVSNKADNERTGVVAPRGQKGTKQPRTGDDRSIGSKLTNKQVGPVEVSYATPELAAIAKSVADDVTAAGQMVLEELLKTTTETVTHQELMQFTLHTLNGVFTGIALQGLTQPVTNWLLTNDHLKKIPGKESTYRLVAKCAEQDPSDPNKAVIRLLDDLELAGKIEAELRQEVASLNQQLGQRISPERLNQLISDLETARKTERRLNEELRNAKIERDRVAKAHQAELELLRQQLTTAENTNQDLQQQLKTKQTGLDDTTKARMRALGYDV